MCARCRQGVFANLHRARIYTRQFVRAELAKQRRVVLQDYNAIRHGMRRWYLGQCHLARLWIQAPDIVGLLVGKPQNAVVIEYRCVRIDLGAIVGSILGYLARRRIQLAHITAGNRGKPYVSIFVCD